MSGICTIVSIQSEKFTLDRYIRPSLRLSPYSRTYVSSQTSYHRGVVDMVLATIHTL